MEIKKDLLKDVDIVEEEKCNYGMAGFQKKLLEGNLAYLIAEKKAPFVIIVDSKNDLMIQ
ncbi:hypothetical protein [Enterococcus sp. AZ081]|uniref:hypothetical protein n=1 Tax=Enterococcus sp. AZ081 TaxID=2774816 RepID=UPI003F26C34D